MQLSDGHTKGESWSKPTCFPKDKGQNPRFVVTNMAAESQSLYKLYCGRGDCENRIRELEVNLASGRTRRDRFADNWFRLVLHAAAFVLLSALHTSLAGTALAKSGLGQIRLKLV